ncbi:MAG: sensor N-terminal transmembrane domain-containing protein [Alphaproteobacteria bacterium]|nr:sensor N-terminal transmembrane domain-containing protein [Alphaproteobacteria bacterium]MBO4643126.1 sensor N-terminal transmembrane domain-containing protein [Alphaproteobacteria bacterium]
MFHASEHFKTFFQRFRRRWSTFKTLSVIRSPLSWRLMLLNLLAPALLVAGLFYMDHYQTGLIDAEIKVLKIHAELMAVAVSEGAVNSDFSSSSQPLEQERTESVGYYREEQPQNSFFSDFGRSGNLWARMPREIFRLIPDAARRILQRLPSLDRVRVRLFDHNGVLTADSRLGNEKFRTQISEQKENIFLIGLDNSNLPRYDEPKNQTAFDYQEVGAALGDGVFSSEIRFLEGYGRILSVAVPVVFEDQIVGAIMVTGGIENVLKNLIAFRLAVFRLFGLTFAVTFLLSYFMMRTIVIPLNRLSTAAVNIRVSGGRRQRIPDETKRDDEIGVLSGALIKMTDTLWERLDATERFAADVSHEIKNPLSSMRSALETIDFISNEDKKKRLISIIHNDVLRLDRLITDISNLSRLDAELSREVFEVINIHKLLSSMIEVYNIGDAATKRGIRFTLRWDSGLSEDVMVLGMETRLAQVFYNLISNAISFTPDNSEISVDVRMNGAFLEMRFNDEGKGIPPGEEEKLFERFYCERPTSEQFGNHSGLGLSISEKIISGFNGKIYAENRKAPDGGILGASFVILLPVYKETP